MSISAPAGPPTVGELIDQCSGRLGSATEARWMVEHAIGTGPASVAAHLSDPVPDVVRRTVASWTARRLAGEPLQYVLGSWPFRRVELVVDRRVLVPRPETEVVAGIALDVVGAGAPSPGGTRRVADLGTGSGAIALSLAVEGPGDLEIWATDRSVEALAVARANVAVVGRRQPDAAQRVHVVAGSWFAALPVGLAGELSLVVSNPPYVSEAEWAGLDPVVRDHEPRRALVPGPTGLEAITEIVTGSPRWLVAGGCIVVELAPHQAEAVSAAADQAGYRDVRVEDDLAGRARALVATWPGP